MVAQRYAHLSSQNLHVVCGNTHMLMHTHADPHSCWPTHMLTHTHTDVHTFRNTHMLTHTYADTYIYWHTHMLTPTHADIHACWSTLMLTHTHADTGALSLLSALTPKWCHPMAERTWYYDLCCFGFTMHSILTFHHSGFCWSLLLQYQISNFLALVEVALLICK